MEYNNWLERTELLLGKEALDKLANAKILVVGLGGVGSFAAEFLVRGGVGTMTIIDGDKLDPTNKNRQLPALDSTVGVYKADVLADRFKDINKEINLTVIKQFMNPEDMMELLVKEKFDFILDCIDSVSPKVTLLTQARRTKTKVVSSMGAGGKVDPTKVKIKDISKTKECKFAACVRKSLKKNKINKGIIAVYSEEIQPKSALALTDGSNFKKSYYGTCSYMPAMFGLMMASEVLRRVGGLK